MFLWPAGRRRLRIRCDYPGSWRVRGQGLGAKLNRLLFGFLETEIPPQHASGRAGHRPDAAVGGRRRRVAEVRRRAGALRAWQQLSA
jgi:hypothetical protein